MHIVDYLIHLVPLQLFYYETVSVEGPGSLAPALGPCLSSWGEEEITEREKRERELGGYGFGEVYLHFQWVALQNMRSFVMFLLCRSSVRRVA